MKSSILAQPSLEGIVRNWTFERSSPTLVGRLSRAKSFLTGYRPAPPYRALRPVDGRNRWNSYFLFLPNGQLTPGHYFTLGRLRALRGGLMVVCATPRPEDVPRDLIALSDALYWKGLSGFDFSAYAIALDEVATRSSGADLLILNDSVYGPFVDLDAMLDNSQWQMTGFTATSAFENHIQSYAFFLRQVTFARARSLHTVMPRHLAFNHFRHVVNCQETRLAREASRTMSVGSFWFADASRTGDPSLALAPLLLDIGFPFLKRSLLGKLDGIYNRATIKNLLEDRGHPV